MEMPHDRFGGCFPRPAFDR